MADQTPLFSNTPKMNKLLEFNHKLCGVYSAMTVLEWDMETYMPAGGAEARGYLMATLAGIAHDILDDVTLGALLMSLGDEMRPGGSFDNFTVYDRALVRETRRAYNRATKVPKRLVEEQSLAHSAGNELWKKARKASRFEIFRDALKRIVELKLEEAHCVGFEGTPYNLFLDDYEQGLTVDFVDRVFGELKAITAEVLGKIRKSGVKIDQSILKVKVPDQKLMAFANKVLAGMGLDFNCGRQDISAHPFSTSFDPTDVRVTNRLGEQFFSSSIFSAIHEGGHALYEQGIDRRLSRTLLCGGTSFGIHESQSRLWENMVGRSFAFWDCRYGMMLLAFGLDSGKLGDRGAGSKFIRAVNKVTPNYIRVDSDEVTYNLHIIMRYEIERDLFERRIAVDDLPEVWNEKLRRSLGLGTPPDADGVLQDIHWSGGGFGYFPTYSLGNLYAAQIFNKACLDLGGSDINQMIAQGEMAPLREWLRENIHQYGSVYPPAELTRKVTGENLNTKYFREYLLRKFGVIYGF